MLKLNNKQTHPAYFSETKQVDKKVMKQYQALFKVPKENIPNRNLHQQTCNTAKTNSMLQMVNVAFSASRLLMMRMHKLVIRCQDQMEDTKLDQCQNTCSGMMDLNKNKVSFNFLKSVEVKSINNEIGLLHPSAHELWQEEEIRNRLMEILVG